MCLDNVYEKKQKEQALKRLPDEFWGWRICMKATKLSRKKTGYYPWAQRSQLRFRAGLNKAIQERIGFRYSYLSGFHFLLTKKNIKRWHPWYEKDGYRRMHCRIKKKWITAIGKQQGLLCVVVSKAIFPKYCN